jgi:PhzF family phenazine biosynthesis protein
MAYHRAGAWTFRAPHAWPTILAPSSTSASTLDDEVPQMRTRMFQLDSFTTRRFAGNPAAVVTLGEFLPDAVMQSIAAENNLSETAFVVPDGRDYRLRWFTPTVEVPLCGHATLATGAVVLERLEPGREEVVFHTASGPLTVRGGGGRYVMDFPARPSLPTEAPDGFAEALGAVPLEVFGHALDYIALLASAEVVRELAPDMTALLRLDRGGVIVTAPGDATGSRDGYDFVSRYFAPRKGIPEDPVTGGAHCSLTPFWAKRLGKAAFRAFQASRRGGEMRCRLLASGTAEGDRVELEGACVFFFEGVIEDLDPFSKVEVRGDDNAAALIALGEEVEEPPRSSAAGS